MLTSVRGSSTCSAFFASSARDERHALDRSDIPGTACRPSRDEVVHHDGECRRIGRLVTGSIIAGLVAVGAAVCILISGAELSHAEEPARAALTLSGIASWYGPGLHGRKTANGERYNMYALTAAHRSLPFGTKVQVTNRKNGKSVVVRINDRGPYVGTRVIDLSRGAAQAVSMSDVGIAPVRLDVLSSL